MSGHPAAPRTLLVTGPGGSGRTTVAAATAVASAARGSRRTLLLSTEEPGVLAEVLGAGDAGIGRLVGADGANDSSDGANSSRTRSGSSDAAGTAGAAPEMPDVPETPEVPGAPGLWAARVDSAGRFRRTVAALQERAGSALDLLGAEPLDEDELTELPGADAHALLHALRAAHASGRWDAVVVDLPPVRGALSVLTLPERLRRYLRRLAPPERQAARALRPMLTQLAGVPMPTRELYDTVSRWDRELAAVQEMLESPDTGVRLVVEPGPLAVEALRTARAGLGLYGLRLESFVANRLLPTDGPDGWPAALSGRQQAALKQLKQLPELHGSHGPFAPAWHELPHLGRDPRGAADLAALDAPGRLAAYATEYATQHATEHAPPTHRTPAGRTPPDHPAPVVGRLDDRLADEGLLVWRLPLPGARTSEVDLVRRGDELIVTAGPHRRTLPLPSALCRCRVAGAALEAGELCVRFAPDERLWPTGRPGRPGRRTG